MKRKKILSVFIFLAVACVARAGTVIATNISSPSSDVVISGADGNALSGSIVAVGWYDSGFDVNAAVLANDFSSLSSSENFNVLVTTLTGDTGNDFGSDIAGFYSTVQFDYGAPSVPMTGAQLYVIFGDASTLAGNNTQYALVRFNETIGSDSPLADSNSLQLSGGSYTILAGTTSTAEVDLSSIGGSATESNQSLQLVTVPEPSAALLGGLGALALLRRRRVA